MKTNRMVLTAALLLGVVVLASQPLQWEHYSSGKHILSLDADWDNIYIGTSQGMAIIDANTGNAEYLNSSNAPLTSNWISSIVTNGDGIVWIGTEDGIWRVQGDNWQCFNTSNSPLPSNRATKLRLTPSGTLWCLSGYHADRDYVCSYDGQSWSVYHNGNSTIPGNVIGEMEVDYSGKAYILYYNTSSEQSGMAVFNGSSWTSSSWSELGMNGAHVSRLLFDGNYLWLTSQVAELYRYNNGQVQTYPYSSTLGAETIITSLDKDNEGNLLLGLGIAGEFPTRLARFNDNNWTMLDPNTTACLLGLPVATAEDANGKLWLGTSNGLTMLQEGEWQMVHTTSSPLPTNVISDIALDNQDNLWLGLYGYLDGVGGIMNKTGEDWVFYPWNEYNMPSREIKLLTNDNNGKLWFTSMNPSTQNEAITCYDGETWQSFSFDSGNFPSAWFCCIETDRFNNLWTQVFNRTEQEYLLMKYDGTTWTEESSLPYRAIDIAFDNQNNLWLASDMGLLKHQSYGVYQHFWTGNSGLPNNNVTCLAVGANNSLWIGMTEGLAWYLNGQWEVWNAADTNLPYRSYKDISLDAEGRIWAATDASGLLCFDGVAWTEYTENNSPILSNSLSHLEIDSQQNLWLSYRMGGLSKIALNPSDIQEEPLLPVNKALELSNYPNPFNPETTISFKLSEPAPVTLNVYNTKGQMVRQLFSGSKAAGLQSLAFDGKDAQGRALSSGIYFLKLQAGSYQETRKLLLMK